MKRILILITPFLLALLCSAQRLPKNVVPDNYKLTFTPDFSKNNFEGDEIIHVRLLQPSSEIVLHAVDIDFHEVTVSSGGRSQTAKVTLDKAKEWATFTLGKPLPAGPATIHIRYTGILNDEMRGFYLGKDDQGRKYAATQLEDVDARRAFPSFDEPIFKATFEVTVVADQGLTVISNGKVLSDTPGPDGKHTVHFANTPKMSSYLVAVVVGNFECIEGASDGIPIRVYTSTGKKNLAPFALKAAESFLHYYDEYFGIKYPYGKLDLVGLADFGPGAMENTGCITFREVLLMLDENHSSITGKKTVASVIAHEMAHQWFGDLVTMQWWDDKWLNEGFATWMSSKPVAAWKPEWNVSLDDVSDAIRSLDLDSLVNTHAIHHHVETAEQIAESDDAITYGKAAAVLRMLESYVGPETFRAGVNAYLKKYSYANAAAGDFWREHAAASKKPVDKIMPTWVEQAGAPLLSVNTSCSRNGETVQLEQRRYFYDRARLQQGSPELWQVPVCMRAGSADPGAPPKCELMTQKRQSVTLPVCSRSIYVNANAMGFYRSGYASDELAAMAKNIETNFSPAERVMLLADVWASVQVGREPIGDFLTLAENLKNERNDVVLVELLLKLRYIGEQLTNDSDRESYELWLRGLVSAIAADVGWTPRPGDPETMSALRGILLYTLAAVARDPDAQSVAHKLADQALADPNSLDGEIALRAMQTAADNGDAAFYERVRADLKNVKNPELYLRDSVALAGFRDPKLVERTLEFAVSEMRSQDSPYLIARILRQPAAQKLAWSFIQANWPKVEKLAGLYGVSVVVGSTAGFCDARLREQVRDFFTAHPTPSAERSLKQALERMNYCIDLKTRQQTELASWLKGKGGSQSGGAAVH